MMIESLFEAWSGALDFWNQVLVFLDLTFRALGIGLLISIPLGILLSRAQRFASPLMSVLALVQTIPSLALLGFCVSMLAVSGEMMAITAAVVYSVFPIVLNTYVGITQVDPALTDAAKGMGMTRNQVLWKVELPLSIPVIMAGVRTGAVYAIGMITICALAGAPGLGSYVTRGISGGNSGLTLLGVLPILGITTLLFWGLGSIADLARKKGALGLWLGSGLVALMALYALAHPLLAQQRPPAEVIEDVREDASLLTAWRDSITFNEQAARFILLMMRGLGIALLVSLPIGVLLTRAPKLAQPLISVLGMIQTIPSLALLGFVITLLPIFGPTAAVFATVVYTLFPLVLNTYTGIIQVDPRIKDSAKGMGMTSSQILWKVEIPLALPVIMAGVRTAATYAIAMVTISTLVGARGLGEFIVTGMNEDNASKILLGVIPILLFSFVVFWTLSGLTWITRKRVVLGQLICGTLIVLLAGYGLVDPLFRKRPDIRIGSKNFVESRVLGEMMKIMLQEHTDLKVELTPNLGSNFTYKSLQAGLLDAYPEYSGTLLTAKDALAYETIPEDRSKIDQLVREEMKERFDLALLEPFGVDNGYAISVNKIEAQKHDLRTVGDLRKVPSFRIVTPQEFPDRPDGWGRPGKPGLKDKYDLPQKKLTLVTPSLLYKQLLNGNAEVVIGFVTDWQRDYYKDNLATLADDRNFFPEYLAVPLVRVETLEKYPKIEEVLNRLKGKISDDDMRNLNREVIQKRRGAAEVARAFLEQRGLISKRAK